MGENDDRVLSLGRLAEGKDVGGTKGCAGQVLVDDSAHLKVDGRQVKGVGEQKAKQIRTKARIRRGQASLTASSVSADPIALSG